MKIFRTAILNCIVALGFALLAILSPSYSYADISWPSGTKAPGDYTSDGIVTVTGPVTLQAGTYTFATLIVDTGATLTLQGNTGSDSGVIINANSITVTGTISANIQGFGSAAGTGRGANGSYAAGGGYGGAGGDSSSMGVYGGATYGSAFNPTRLGSGGGQFSSYLGGSGGGAIKLVVSGTATINGTLSANGGNGQSDSGGGSGGSIWVSAATVAGSGNINAIGGNGFGSSAGGGGGGRIYIEYSSANNFSGGYSVAGGTPAAYKGANGTVLIHNTVSNDITCTASTSLSLYNSDFPSPLGALLVQGGCKLTLLDAVSSGAVTVTGSGSVLTVSGNLTASGSLNVSSTATVIVTGNTITGLGYTISATNITVDLGASISANTQGFGSYLGPGRGANGSYAAGGGYGGAGGDSSSAGVYGGPTYGSAINPTQLGSGGGQFSSYLGGSGGGAIKLVASGTATINGTLSANGGNGQSDSGGGSGGSIWVSAATVAGSGNINAIGGNGFGSSAGGGGGGRIYIDYSSANSFSGGYSVAGGTPAAYKGANGTVLIFNSTSNDLYVTLSTSLSAGTYTFNNVTVTNGATLTLQGNTGTDSGVTLNAVNITVDAGASISANAQGFGSAAGTGRGANGSYAAGGGYGGAGGDSISAGVYGGPTYGSAFNPTRLGSGGGQFSSYLGGSGGGAIKLVVSGTVTINGTLSANGGNGQSDSGGGSGGSIWVSAGTVAGSGNINAIGGNGFGSFAGGGGGGRIYIDYSSANSFSGGFSVAGGTPAAYRGASGSVLIHNTASNDISCTASAPMTLNNSDFPSPLGALLVQGGCKLTIQGDLFPASVVVSGSGSNLYMYGNLAASGSITISASGTITILGNTITGFSFKVLASTITIDAGATLTANSQGFPSASGLGPGVNGSYGSGGGYGGVGGSGTGAGGTTYGSATNPINLGSGGGSSGTDYGGSGGGGIHIIVLGTMTVNGTVSANGGNGIGDGGAGSGGSIWINATTIAGNGSVTANGGNGNGSSGRGGGGRVAAAFVTDNSTITRTANRGTAGSSTGSTNGSVVWGALNAATKLFFSLQPSVNARAGEAFVIQPVVAAQDVNGNTTPSFSDTVTITAYSDASCTTSVGGTLTGTTGNTIYGTSFFNGVSYATKMTTIYLRASASGVTSACSTAVNIGGQAAVKLAFTIQPSSNAVAGVAFAQQPQLTAQDNGGDPDYMQSAALTITVFTDATCTTAASGGTLNGSSSSAWNLGVINFSGMSYTKASTVYLKATSGSLTTACSTAIVVTNGAATKLVFVTQPSTPTTAGVNLTQQPVVEAQDAYGNIDPTFVAAVTQNIYTNFLCTTVSSGGTLTGSTSTSSGTVTFSDVSYTKSGNYYLGAASGSLKGCSSVFTISAGPAVSLGFSVQPVVRGVVSVNLKSSFAVTAYDQYSNIATSFTSAVSLAPYTDSGCTTSGGGTLSTTSVNASSGVATFNNNNTNRVRYNVPGSLYIGASAGALTPVCSTAISLIPHVPTFFRGY